MTLKNKISRRKKSSITTELVKSNISMDRKQRTTFTNSRLERSFCFRNFKKYLLETTLHGLRFVGDDRLTVWERLFFLAAFIAAVCATAHFISFIYARWESTPVLIGTNPFPTSISDIPFPAVTLCNMNQLSLSKVSKYGPTSQQKALMDMACFTEVVTDDENVPEYYSNNNLSLSDFILNHAQSCEDLILHCKFSSTKHACADLFKETVTDEGYCCVFNLLHAKYRYINHENIREEYTNTDGTEPVSWDPEKGYQKNLPEKYFPRPGSGIGVTMGLSIILDAQVDEYYCASTNGPGFKISLHNPMEAPRVRDIGVSIAVGQEIRLRVEVSSSSAAPTIRPLQPKSRLCLFGDEGYHLKVYKYYTRRNCENECQAEYVYGACQCIPYNLPLIITNSTICGAPHVLCMNNAMTAWLRSGNSTCRNRCLSPCFDLTYTSTAFPAPLVEGTYFVQDDEFFRPMNRTYLRKNIAVVHLFFREFVFHGNVRNVYVGFTEFLSNTGGILGLFLGFSFISLAEAFYYAFIRPIFWSRRPASTKVAVATQEKNENNPDDYWLGNEIFQPRREYIWRSSVFQNFMNERKKSTSLGFKPMKKLTGIQRTPWI